MPQLFSHSLGIWFPWSSVAEDDFRVYILQHVFMWSQPYVKTYKPFFYLGVTSTWKNPGLGPVDKWEWNSLFTREGGPTCFKSGSPLRRARAWEPLPSHRTRWRWVNVHRRVAQKELTLSLLVGTSKTLVNLYLEAVKVTFLFQLKGKQVEFIEVNRDKSPLGFHL